MNDVREDGANNAPQRKARRKGAAWKSGLMLSGLGAVVLGAGYLAGVNAPAVAQSAAQASTPASVAQNSAAASVNAQNSQRQPVAPSLSDDDAAAAEDGVVIGFDEQGNPVIMKSDGSLQFGNGSTGSSTQQFGRRGRQFGGSSRQTPSFGAPMARSRGS